MAIIARLAVITTITTIIIAVFMVTSQITSSRMTGIAAVVLAETNGTMEVISWQVNITSNHILM